MNYEEFYELAALYAIDVLDEKERRLVEDYIAQFPECQVELEELRNSFAVIPYSAPEVPMAADVKKRLFEQIAEDAAIQNNHRAVDHPIIDNNLPFFTVRAADVHWQPHRIPGVAIAKLYEDLVKREIVCLLRAEPGVQYPQHRHALTEEIFMIEGDLVINEQIYGKGDYIRSAPGTIHSPYTQHGCMLFIRTSLDNEILN